MRTDLAVEEGVDHVRGRDSAPIVLEYGDPGIGRPPLFPTAGSPLPPPRHRRPPGCVTTIATSFGTER
jgi:hypothetical protein